MKQSNLTIKIAGYLIFAALLAWLGIYGAQALDDPFRTVQAVKYTVRDSAPVSGIVVRDEEVLYSLYSTVYISAQEGKRVAAGQTVAEAFDSEEALRWAVRVGELEQQIQTLSAQAAGVASASDMLRLEEGIAADVKTLRKSLAQRQLTDVDALSLRLQTKVFSAFSDDGSLARRLVACQEELGQLQRQENLRAASINAPASGLYSTAVDGWETLGIRDLKKIAVPDLEALLKEKRTVPDFALGKLVYGSKWTYAVLMDQADAARLRLGTEVSILFGRYFNEQLRMTVSWISNLEEGKRAVLFTCGTNMADILSMRRQEAELVFTEETGLRIPRKGLHVDEAGNACVYVRTGLQAEKKLVTVRFDYDDFYVVNSESLRAGDQVIVSAKDLYDGKVVG